jgi:hypothetical protein
MRELKSKNMNFFQRNHSIYGNVNIILILVGQFLLLISHNSFIPNLVSLIYCLLGTILLKLFHIFSKWERKIYFKVYIIGTIAVGVSGIYRNYLGDAQGDAQLFFYYASSSFIDGASLTDISLISEGPLAIIIWKYLYNIMELLGFPRDQYIAIIFNTLIVAISGVFSMKIALKIYGDDCYRCNRLIFLYSTCGIFFIFSGILLRDSYILLIFNILIYIWCFPLVKYRFNFSVLIVSIISLFFSLLLGFFRTEFLYLPILIGLSALFSLYLSNKIKGVELFSYALFVLVIIGYFFIGYWGDILFLLERGKGGYSDLAVNMASTDSLGIQLIISQPAPIRITLGLISLFFFPIPIWSGFQLGSAYLLFKSLNAIFFYFFIPLFFMGLYQIIKSKFVRSPILLFNIFLAIGLSFLVSSTSLEVRHLAVFYTPFFLVGLLPDLRINKNFKNYIRIFCMLFALIFLAHLVWLLIKINPTIELFLWH